MPARGGSFKGGGGMSIMEGDGPKAKELTNTLGSAVSSRRASLIDSGPGDDVVQMRDFDAKKFEAKKRKIAQRLKAEEDLEAFRQETGGTLGGQWVNQKWVSKNLNDAKKDSSGFDLTLWLKDTVLYMALLFAFTVTIFAGRSTNQIVAFENVFRGIVSRHMANVNTHEDVLSFLRDVTDDIRGQEGNDFIKSDYEFSTEYGSAYGSGLVGPIRVRQVRVKGGACSSAHSQLVEAKLVAGTECYPGFTEEEEETIYSKENATAVPNATTSWYTWVSADDTQQVAIEGKFATYPGSGFLVDVTLQESADIVENLYEEHWLDLKTRMVLIEYMFYSPHMDIFGDTRVMFEFLPSGSIESTELLTVISLSRYPNDGIWSIIRIAMLVFVYMTVIFYVLDDMDTCRLEGLEKYRVIGWPHLDLINNFLFLIAGIFRLANFIMVAIAFPETATDSDIRQKIRSVGDALYIEDQINGLNGFLLWMKLFKFVGVTRRILRLSDTIIRSLRDSIAYMGLFGIISFAFAMLGYLLFGSELYKYQTMTDSMVTIFRAMYGDMDFLEVLATSGTMGFLYLFLWLVVSVTVLLNMFIAILADTYHQVLEEEKLNPQPALLDRGMDELLRLKEKYFFKNEVHDDHEGTEEEQAAKMAEADKKKKKKKKSRGVFGMIFRALKAVVGAVGSTVGRKKKKGEEEDEDEAGDDDDALETSSDEDGDGDEAGDAVKSIEEDNHESMSTAWKPWPSRQVVPLNDGAPIQSYFARKAGASAQGSPGEKQGSQQGSPQRVAMAPGGGAVGKYFDGEVAAEPGEG